MKFVIITQIQHKIKGHKKFSYAPYINEMKLWEKHVSNIHIVSPISNQKIDVNEIAYVKKDIDLIEIKEFNITSFKNLVVTLTRLPLIILKIYKEMKWADHIHLRCPGNVGLLGCFVQVLFPNTPKTVKYAGNWDPNSKQPFSYKLQKWLLSNTFLTKNCKVLIYGNWPKQSKNIISFFTASYSENEIIPLESKSLSKQIKFIFVGNFSVGKQPLKSVQVVEQLHNKGYEVQLDMYGFGSQYEIVENYIQEKNLKKIIHLHGNQPKEIIKKAFQESHFLIFISKSEGWPKVVAEAMFWSCLPVATGVSCVPDMLDSGKRGAIINDNVNEIVDIVESYFNDEQKYKLSLAKAKEWSQKYTTEKFDKAIAKLL